jgi:hypothetical protein
MAKKKSRALVTPLPKRRGDKREGTVRAEGAFAGAAPQIFKGLEPGDVVGLPLEPHRLSVPGVVSNAPNLPLSASTAAKVSMRGELTLATELGPIERRLFERPADIRDAARALSREFTTQVEELNRFKPNDSDSLAKHNDLVAFLKRMAAGLADLADALEQAVSNGTDDRPEPVFLGTAGKIAKQLNLGLMEWLEANRTLVIEVPIRITLFGLGVAFLHSIGADGIPAITALTTLVLKRGGNQEQQEKEEAIEIT